jgi:hypothetical protein
LQESFVKAQTNIRYPSTLISYRIFISYFYSTKASSQNNTSLNRTNRNTVTQTLFQSLLTQLKSIKPFSLHLPTHYPPGTRDTPSGTPSRIPPHRERKRFRSNNTLTLMLTHSKTAALTHALHAQQIPNYCCMSSSRDLDLAYSSVLPFSSLRCQALFKI